MITKKGKLYFGKHLRFELCKQTVNDCSAWYVLNRHDEVWLGSIEWFKKWRCYSFYPKENRVFEKDCLRDIADFCELRKSERGKRNNGQ